MSARDELFQLILGRTTTKAVERIIDAGYQKPEIIGYLVVGKSTSSLDWDDKLYPSEEACIDSLCGPYQDFTRDPASDSYWGKEYKLCPVLSPEAAS